MSIILVSGGLDSATALAWALENTKAPHIPISFFYGQRHAKEQQCSADLCRHFQIPQPRNVNLAQAFSVIGGSSLTSGLVHGNPSTEAVERTESDLPPSFVPGRNLIMLSIAAAIGYTEKVYEIVGGWNAVDYSGYPDCRSAFFFGMRQTINLALGLADASGTPKFHIYTPLIDLSKSEIIQWGLLMKVPYSMTWSCYAGGDIPCGECDSCKIREEGFAKLGMVDPSL